MRCFSALILTLILTSNFSFAQQSGLDFYGDIRIAHIGSDTNADGIGGPNSVMRFRPGVKYLFDEKHSF